jgi:glycosyl transferase, family 25
MENIDKIYYINLEHRKDRKEHIEKIIKEYVDPNLSITTRLNAIYTINDGNIGCAMSHLNIIKDCIINNYNNVLILEDDFEFIIDKNKFHNYLNIFFKIYKDYDILLLGTNIVNGENFENKTDFFKVSDSQTTSGYILNKKIFTKFKDICEESVDGLIACKPESIYCIDQLWKKLQKTENVYAFPERVGKQREDYSDICKKIVNHNV